MNMDEIEITISTSSKKLREPIKTSSTIPTAAYGRATNISLALVMEWHHLRAIPDRGITRIHESRIGLAIDSLQVGLIEEEEKTTAAMIKTVVCPFTPLDALLIVNSTVEDKEEAETYSNLASESTTRIM